VCEENWKSKATMSGFMAGVMLGALILGRMADRIGRRSNMLLTTSGMLLFNTGIGG
jgi:MFS family permease